MDTDFYAIVLYVPTACLWNSASKWLRLSLRRPETSDWSCSILAPEAETNLKLGTHEDLLIHCISFDFQVISVLVFWVIAIKTFMQLTCIFVHLRILLPRYAHRPAMYWHVTYAGDSTGTVLDFFRDALSVSCNQTWLRYMNQGGRLSAHLDSFSDLKGK